MIKVIKLKVSDSFHFNIRQAETNLHLASSLYYKNAEDCDIAADIIEEATNGKRIDGRALAFGKWLNEWCHKEKGMPENTWINEDRGLITTVEAYAYFCELYGI